MSLLLHLLSSTPSERKKHKRCHPQNDDGGSSRYQRETDAAVRLFDLRHGA
ncbi:hypothetical protein [Microbacterium enclense]|uniref:hypothetical protein n=1 Tax=Microbacterium enclense TaxID=993073 RepID=UPI001E586FD4|nr:hypothetical protein [Microbacterium enclense]